MNISKKKSNYWYQLGHMTILKGIPTQTDAWLDMIGLSAVMQFVNVEISHSSGEFFIKLQKLRIWLNFSSII
jgi:hypothetical protein